MIDILLASWALAAGVLALKDEAPRSDPGPSARCPTNMRLVRGTHFDEVEHLCADPRHDKKDTHCYAYVEDVTFEEGEQTDVSVCMDQYEAPNRKGARPLVMQSFRSAERWCKQHDRRLCTEQEWELACEGPEHLPLVYGWAVDLSVCNSARAWRPFNVERLKAGGAEAQAEVERLWQGAPSGVYPRCMSSDGIFDLTGNIEEWVITRKGRAWPGALMGGFWAKPWTGCRGTNDAHEPTFTFYETGFRCCKDPTAPKIEH